MKAAEFTELASHSSLTQRQAEAFFRRNVRGESRHEAADAMDTSPSNVDNLERAARGKVMNAQNLLNLLASAGYDDLRSVGVCASCDEPVDPLRPQAGQEGVPAEEWVMVCEDCYEG